MAKEKTYFWVLENDGHNSPTWHKFRDEGQAIWYLKKLLGEDANVNVDDDGTEELEECTGDSLWMPFGESPDPPQLYVYDQTDQTGSE